MGINLPASFTGILKAFDDPGFWYDEEGKLKVSKAWEQANMKKATSLPFGISKLYVNKKIEPALREALRRAESLAPDYKIYRIGAFNPRHQRHDKTRPPSLHSWGIAVDINADTNKPGTKGDMPSEFVKAFESTGWSWGGRWSSYRDPMHFEMKTAGLTWKEGAGSLLMLAVVIGAWYMLIK